MENRHGQQQPQHLALAETATVISSPTGRRPLVFDKMEALVREMQDPENGVPVKSQKLFLTSIPSAFMGYDMIEWLMERLSIEDSVTAEAIHIANLLCQHGYFFPVGECKNLVVKDDSSLYRFQTPYFWPSQNHNPDNTEYAIYLYKRSLRNKQKHGLEDYEMEALNKLKKQLAHKWEFIVMQAEEQVRLAKDRKKGDKIVTDSQERAYWRAYRPPPGFFNCLELPPVPAASISQIGDHDGNSPDGHMLTGRRWKNKDDLKTEVEFLRSQLNRARIKASQAAEGLQHHCATYAEYDAFIYPPQPSNPWISDDGTLWILNSAIVDVPTEKRVKRWGISIEDLVVDQTGLQELTNYLRKEYSHENIRFWLATNELRTGPASRISQRVQEIYEEFLAPGAPCEINIDGRTMEKVQQEMKNPSRFTFDPAAEHVYNLLLKKDCYPRFVRSEHYKNLLANALQPSQKKRFFSFGATGKKKSSAVPSTSAQPCQASLKRRGSDRSLSGSPPDQTNLGIISSHMSATTPGEECDTPYRGDMPSLRVASAPHLFGQSISGSLSERRERDEVCPWESMSPPTPRASSAVASVSGRTPESNRLLTAGPSICSSVDVDSTSPGKMSRSSVESNPSTDLDICPWEAVPPPVNRKHSNPSAKKNSAEIEVCPWEMYENLPSSDMTSFISDDPVLHSTSSPVVVVGHVSVDPPCTTMTLSTTVESHCTEEEAMKPEEPCNTASEMVETLLTSNLVVESSVQVPVSSFESDNVPVDSQVKEILSERTEAAPSPSSSRKASTTSTGETWETHKPAAKISDICPWEDEESCKLDQPFVKTYATLGYL